MQSVKDLEVLATKGNKAAKKELARRLLDGEGAEKNGERALRLLEECIALGDAEAMMTLAKCCGLGYGMIQNVKRTRELISQSAKKRNLESQLLMRLIKKSQGEEKTNSNRLQKTVIRRQHINL